MAYGRGGPGLRQHSTALKAAIWLTAATWILAAPVCAQAQDFVFSTKTLPLGGNNANPLGVQVADFNGDKWLDIASLNAGGGTVSVFLGKGDGTFADPVTTTVGASPKTFVVADFNRDGKLDMAVSFTSTPGISIFMGNGDGTFGLPLPPIGTGGSGYSLTAVDFNADGAPDILATDFSNNRLLLFPGNGNGSFGFGTLNTGLDPISVALIDFNLDGRPDLVVANQFDGNASVFLGNATGFNLFSFFTVSVPNATNVVSGDFNNDGVGDLAFLGGGGPSGGVTRDGVATPHSSGPGTLTVALNRPDRPGVFSAPVTATIPGSGFSNMAVADLNGDGKRDYAFPLADTNQVVIYNGADIVAAGTLFANEVRPMAVTPVASVGTGSGPTGVVVGDLNGDGKPDMVVPNSGGNSIGVYINGSQSRILPQTGWWWDSTLNGTGFFLETGGGSGNGMFAGGFLYDASGNSTWLVSTGQMNGVLSYSNNWLKVTGGQTLTGTYHAPAGNTNVGKLEITFLDATHATMLRPNNTTVNLHRFSFSGTTVPAPPVAGAPQNGWWWGGVALSGSGYGIEIQGSNVFIVAYVYDGAGNPVWYLATGALATPTSYSGSWSLYKGGPQLTSPEGKYAASQVTGSDVAMTLTFSDATHGTLTMGNVVIPIVRFQQF